MSFTYSTLKSKIQEYAEDDSTEFQNNLDTIIDLAEVRIARELDLQAFKKNGTISLTSGVQTGNFPSDMVTPRWVRIQNGDYLLQKDESFMRQFQSSSATTGTPRYYSFESSGNDNDQTILVAPTPASNTTLEIGYTYRVTGLSDSNTTTWLSTNAPDVLLYACMVEAASFNKEISEESQRWGGLYERALASIKSEEIVRQRTDEYRAGEMR